MPRDQARKIKREIDKLATDGEGLNSKQLKGREGYRLRIGNYRVLYTKDEIEMVVLVVKIGPRGDIYK